MRSASPPPRSFGCRAHPGDGTHTAQCALLHPAFPLTPRVFGPTCSTVPRVSGRPTRVSLLAVFGLFALHSGSFGLSVTIPAFDAWLCRLVAYVCGHVQPDGELA